jgi:transmembrane sensor
MNDPLDHDDPIEEVASNWLTQRAEGFSSAQKRDFDRWCRADPRHAAAVARLEAACALLEKMPLVRAELQPVVEFPVKSRGPVAAQKVPVLRLVVGLAAVVALTALGWWRWPRPASSAQLYATSAGGYERVVLADGSVVELNANTDVRVTLAPAERRVALVRGEAHFTVAPDTARPFVVVAHGIAVRAVGTAFNVRLAAAAVEVLVTEGKVAVSDARPAPAAGQPRGGREDRDGSPTIGSPTYLSANERTLIALPALTTAASPARLVEPIATEALREALSWQERKLVFTDTPLRDVVAQFNRRNRTQLVLGDASLAARPVGGTFAADNVEGFIRLLEGSGSIAVERRVDGTVVLRTVP